MNLILKNYINSIQNDNAETYYSSVSLCLFCLYGTSLDQDCRGQPHDEAMKRNQHAEGFSRLGKSVNHQNRVR